MLGMLVSYLWYQVAFAQEEVLRVPKSDFIGRTSNEVHASLTLRLTNPSGTQFQVGLALLGHGVLVPPRNAPLIVEHIDYGRLLGVLFFDAESGPDELLLPVIRSTVSSQKCPPLSEAVTKFRSALDAIHSGEISPVSPNGGLSIQVQESTSVQPIHVSLPIIGKSPLNDILALIDIVSACARDARESEALEQFISVTVQQRFDEAMASGDKRFLGVQERSMLVPGVPPEHSRDMSTSKVLPIPGTSGTYSTPREKQLNDEARRYAETYNARLLQER
jgi:hypothetical protein